MRKIEEVLRLRWGAKLSLRDVAKATGAGKTTVSECLTRAQAAGLSWPLPPEIDGVQLERLLYPAQPVARASERALPDWEDVHRELRGKGVTLSLLWQEYLERHPQGLGYSQFCELYGRWKGRLDVVMRQSHRAGEKLFVDYAGQTLGVIDAASGVLREAQIFVAVLGASSYTFAEATWTQGLADWIGSHVRAFAFLGGAPAIIVPDNLKSAVSRAHRYEPDLNPTYQDFATHYGVAVIPARVRKPRDKAKAEAGVLLIERWILARLRHREFFSLAELNAAISALLTELNARPFKKLEGSRASVFAAIDRAALRPLPSAPYEYAEWRKARVAPNVHVEVDGHYYSVPHALIKRQLDVRLSGTGVELFHQGQRVAVHPRSHRRGGYSTLSVHLPERHRHYLEWTPARLLAERPYPQQAYNACFGVLRLAKEYSEGRLEAACARALAIGTVSYKSLASILANGLDRRPLPEPAPQGEPIAHENLRGPGYYD